VTQQLVIPEDQRLSARIRQAAARNTLGHAVILSGQGDLPRAARFLAAAMECTGEDAPCGLCPACQKVLRDIHPDVITVQDPEHKNISMDVLRQLRTDAYIMPNEGRRKIYIFPDCQILDPKTQNVLLKVLEEGPPQAAFIFCTESSATLLQTIRSRSVEWRLSPAAAAEEGRDENARELCALLCEKRAADITAFFTDLENSKISREQLQRLLSQSRDILCRALAASYGCGAHHSEQQLADRLGRQKLSRLTDLLQEFIRQCGYNIGVGHMTGALAVALVQCLRE